MAEPLDTNCGSLLQAGPDDIIHALARLRLEITDSPDGAIRSVLTTEFRKKAAEAIVAGIKVGEKLAGAIEYERSLKNSDLDEERKREEEAKKNDAMALAPFQINIPLDVKDPGGMNFSPDGKYLAVVSGRAEAWIYETSTGQLSQIIRVQQSVNIWYVHWAPDGLSLALSGSTPKISLWDLKTGTESVVTSTDITKNSSRRLSLEGNVVNYDGNLLKEIRLPDRSILETIVTDDGKTIATKSQGIHVHLWKRGFK